jgi:glyoxylate/hydroxypyruvate reductase A
MSLLLISKDRDMKPVKNELLEIDPNLDIEIWPRVENKERVNFAVTWNHPDHIFSNYPNLRVISSYGAGADHLLNDESIPKQIEFCRISGPSLTSQMAEYVLNAIQNYRLHTGKYVDQKREAIWNRHQPIPKTDCVVGIMGLGEIGTAAAELLAHHEFEVKGWSRSLKQINGVQCYDEPKLSEFLSVVNILVCLLPLTENTRGILNLEVFKQLKQPAYLINAARGSHHEEEDILYALDTGVLKGATLDVFEEEPLPKNHLFWNRPNIMITPHSASITDPAEAAAVIVDNYKRMLSGLDLNFKVDHNRGY